MSRRHAVGRLALAAGALVAPTGLSACRLLTLPAAAGHGRVLTVGILGGAPLAPPGTSLPDPLNVGPILGPLVQPLQIACARQRHAIPGISDIVLRTSNTSSPWFPLPSGPLTNPRQPIVDDPSVPMPDVVIARHDAVAAVLGVRALDLEHVTQQLPAADVTGIPAGLWRQGRAYAAARGTFQASVPILRNPLVCLVPGHLVAFADGKPWSVEQFGLALAQLAVGLPSSGSVLPFVPFGSGVAEMAAVGSGGRLAQTTPSEAFPSFNRGAVASAIAQTVDWTEYGYQNWLSSSTSCIKMHGYAYRMLMLPAAQVLGGPPAIPKGSGSTAGTWKLAPPPRFDKRPAVPTNHVDALVWRHSPLAQPALTFLGYLLSSEGQALLAPVSAGLAVRPVQATRFLPGGSRPEVASWLAESDYDITMEDAYGTETAANSGAMAAVRAALMGALRELTGHGGGFYPGHTFGLDVLPGMQFGGGPRAPSQAEYRAMLGCRLMPPPRRNVDDVLTQYARQVAG